MIAGVQKCGTSSLADRLGQHPDVRMSKPKELHWFSKADTEHSETSYRAYHEYGWQTSDLDDNLIYGEATPRYVLHDPTGRPVNLEQVARYNPSAKLIILLRDPVDRAYSQWNMLVRKGENPPPFEEIVHSSLRGRRHRYADVLRRGEYGQIASNVLSLFPAENCCFVRMDEIDLNEGEIFRFLGITPVPLLRYRINVGTYATPLSDDLRATLRTHFLEEVQRFGQLTTLDVSDWCDVDG